MDKINMYGLTLEQLSFQMVNLEQKPYRARQLYSWLYRKKVSSFDEMSDIKKDFREVLKEKYTLDIPSVFVDRVSEDGTVKLLLELEDGNKIETVLMHYKYGDALCVTSQVGCNMGCRFCASGLLKKVRNLETHEMLGQFLAMEAYLRSKGDDRKISHIVIMGTGEPFDNYDNVMSFIKICNCQYGLEIGARHITTSTCGVVPGILKYGKEGIQVNLAISLHAPNDEIRNVIMPINKAYPLSKLIPALEEYYKDCSRNPTFEYIMIKDLNDSLDCAKQLVSIAKKTHGFVNLIPYNKVVENEFERSSNNRIHAFHEYLLSKGVKSTIRKEFGSDIEAACGQLRARYEK